MKIAACAFLLAALRCAGVKSIAFQAIAHGFVGGMFFAYGRCSFQGWRRLFAVDLRGDPYLVTGVALTAVEVACFLVFKFLV